MAVASGTVSRRDDASSLTREAAARLDAVLVLDLGAVMATDEPLNWIKSKSIGEVSEIAVMAPILPGFIPGERRTYEERLRAALDSVQQRLNQGTPNDQDRVRSIHFGRVMIIRPEHYLVYSANAAGITPRPLLPVPDDDTLTASARQMPVLAGMGHGNVPALLDDYREISPDAPDLPEDPEARKAAREKLKADRAKDPLYRSWVLTLVEFDGDLKVYFRDIAQYLSGSFDRIFENCDDYPFTTNFERFWAWIRRYQMEANLFYPRYTDLSMVRIRQLQEFKRQFDEFVLTVRSPTGRRVKSMDELFDDFLRRSQQYASDFPTPGGIFVPRSK